MFAESEGFEPPIPEGTPVFKTGAFNHSANSLNKFTWFYFRYFCC